MEMQNESSVGRIDGGSGGAWEMLASPGHVLLARVRILVGKQVNGLLIAIVALIVGALMLFVTGAGARVIHESLSRFAQYVASHAVDAGTPAPAVNRIFVPPVQIAPEVADQLTSIPDAQAWVNASLKRLAAGQQPEYCESAAKITSSWLIAGGQKIGCRISKSTSPARTWIWGIINAGPQGFPQPAGFAGVFVKVNGSWTFANLDAGQPPLPGFVVSVQSNFPRALAEDFPELRSAQ